MSFRPRTAAQWIGLGVCLFGCAVLVGFVGHIVPLVRLQPGRDASMSIDDGLSLVLAGLVLALAVQGARRWTWVTAWLAVALAVLNGASLAESLWDVHLGVDLAGLHYWLADPALRPGRMAPNACAGFLLFAAAVLTLPLIRTGRGPRLMRTLTSLIVVVGATGILGYVVHIEALYTFHGIPAMAPYTAAGLMALALGLWLAWRQQRWNRGSVETSQSGRIMSVATVVLIVVVTGAGMSSFVLLWHLAERDAVASLSLRRDERVAYVHSLMASARERGEAFAHRPELALRLGRTDVATPRLTLPARDFTAVTLRNGRGSTVAAAGRAVGNPSVALPLSSDTYLLWSDGFILRQFLPVMQAARMLGSVVVEQPLPLLAAVGIETSSWGQSGEMGLCGLPRPDSSLLECFPQRLRPFAFTVSRQLYGVNRPMTLALDGDIGVVQAPDYRGQRALAAYAPIPDSGLGLVVKMDTTELYASIRRQLELMVPLLLALTIVGLEILRWQMRPLVQDLVETRNQALSSEARFRAAVESSMDAFYIFECVRHPGTWAITDFRLAYVNRNGEDFAALHAGRCLGSKLSEITRLAPPGEFRDKFAQVVGTRQPLDEDCRMQTSSGAALWLHHQAVPLGDGVAVTMRDITERKEAEQRLTRLAQHDSLTGLANRRAFLQRLERAMARSQRLRSQALLALLYLDIDFFKQINDTWGHAQGDRILKAFAQRLAGCVRAVDLVARMGGDEFTVLLENLDGPGDAERVVEAIFAAMRPTVELEGRALTITCSIGMAFYSGEALTLDELLNRADAALYAAKRQGRNQYRVDAA